MCCSQVYKGMHYPQEAESGDAHEPEAAQRSASGNGGNGGNGGGRGSSCGGGRGDPFPSSGSSRHQAAPASVVALEQQRANLLCVKYMSDGGGHGLSGHYQALIVSAAARRRGGGGPTLGELLRCLDLYDVRYVVTDG